mgnify:CR=1 FL=1
MENYTTFTSQISQFPQQASRRFIRAKKIKAKDGEAEGQLYNLVNDPAERTNLWLEQPEVVARLTQKLDGWKESGRTR